MSEKIHLSKTEKVRIPEIDHADSIRFCPKCGRTIPSDQQACIFCKNTGTIPRPSRPVHNKILLVVLIIIIFLLMLLIVLFLTRKTGMALPTGTF